MSDATHPEARKRSSAVQRGGSERREPGPCDAVNEVLALLSRVVQRDIVPNLIIANRVIGEDAAQTAASAVWHDGGFNAERGERDIRFASNHIRMVDVARFVRLLRGTGADAAPALVEVLLGRGIARSELYLDLLGPAARMIGDMWLDDECSFAEVSMVVARLHQILNALRDDHAPVASGEGVPTILFSVAPGEQHSFGIAVAEAFFQEAGWQARQTHSNDADVIVDMVATQHVDAIGLSMSNDGLADVLRATIMRLRASSANRDILVLVGGPAFEAAPALHAFVGADAVVSAGTAGAIEAKQFLRRHGEMHV